MADEVVLGFDFGERRTGIAIANTVTRQARPLTTIEAHDSGCPLERGPDAWSTSGTRPASSSASRVTRMARRTK